MEIQRVKVNPDALRYYRKKKGLTQAQLAGYTANTETYICSLESKSGHTTDLGSMAAIAIVLGVRLSDIVTKYEPILNPFDYLSDNMRNILTNSGFKREDALVDDYTVPANPPSCLASVVQPWLSECGASWKQQTVVLSALRGCDGQSKHDLSKKLTRQLRSVILQNAGQADTTFMRNGMTLDDVRTLAEDSDKYPIHYYMHSLHAAEIIGFKHPDPEIRKWFHECYLIMVDALHLMPETEEHCDWRLRDGVNTPFTEIDEQNEYHP